MKDNKHWKPGGFYPPEEEPENPIIKHILDDGPGGPGKWTREKEKKWWEHKKPWEQNPDSKPFMEGGLDDISSHEG